MSAIQRKRKEKIVLVGVAGGDWRGAACIFSCEMIEFTSARLPSAIVALQTTGKNKRHTAPLVSEISRQALSTYKEGSCKETANNATMSFENIKPKLFENQQA